MLKRTKPMASNQGLYNLFLVAGLLWAVFAKDSSIALCFLLFVLIAGVFGGITLNRKPIIAQAVPAAIAIAVLYLS